MECFLPQIVEAESSYSYTFYTFSDTIDASSLSYKLSSSHSYLYIYGNYISGRSLVSGTRYTVYSAPLIYLTFTGNYLIFTRAEMAGYADPTVCFIAIGSESKDPIT